MPQDLTVNGDLVLTSARRRLQSESELESALIGRVEQLEADALDMERDHEDLKETLRDSSP